MICKKGELEIEQSVKSMMGSEGVKPGVETKSLRGN